MNLQEKASPQLEDGHTRIANELLQALYKYTFSGIELQIVLVVIRYTYGWGRKTSAISYAELKKELGSDMRYIKKTVNKLVIDKVLFKAKKDNRNILGLNKNYLSWRLWITNAHDGEKDTMVVSDTTPK